MTKSLHQIIYVSSANDVLDDDTLLSLLETAREANYQHNITGMMLYHDGNIMQVVEGIESSVNQLMNNILQDPRHHGIQILVNEAIAERSFSEWSMAFKNTSTIDTFGFSNFLSSSFDDIAIAGGKAKQILISFRDHLR